ncbi:uncharacterized protein LOC115446453 [Manduca sexta]|uniref:uncharacterized protein LOC115446453 n=1 Tax=Manduca sexta TaxID=7130 RepID=UPI00188DEE6F|nr:uncharacterized protein LOC115446453 [Manduca sexta]
MVPKKQFEKTSRVFPLIYFKRQYGFILATDSNLPANWSCRWGSGEIPFVFNFYSLSLKRLISLVHKGHSYIEERSCLVFKESNSMDLNQDQNNTYLYYSYSGVLENCCLPFFTKPVGRRLVLITPLCSLPAEVAHATLHGLGLRHPKNEPFAEYRTKSVLFPHHCPDYVRKIKMFNSKV